MIKTLTVAKNAWPSLANQIEKDYGKAAVLIRSRMKEVLGCTVREHREPLDVSDVWYPVRSQITIKLDFYDELKQTMFILKYSDYITNTSME